MTQKPPILASSCARAATAEELRYRIDGPEPEARSARIIALDAGAAQVLAEVQHGPWRGAHFLVHRPDDDVIRGNGAPPDVVLEPLEGEGALRLSDELDGADMVVMVATASDGAEAAAAIGEACYRRGIMTGGVVFGDTTNVGRAVAALRPQAQVLLVTEDHDDLLEILTALRA